MNPTIDSEVITERPFRTWIFLENIRGQKREIRKFLLSFTTSQRLHAMKEATYQNVIRFQEEQVFHTLITENNSHQRHLSK